MFCTCLFTQLPGTYSFFQVLITKAIQRRITNEQNQLLDKIALEQGVLVSTDSFFA